MTKAATILGIVVAVLMISFLAGGLMMGHYGGVMDGDGGMMTGYRLHFNDAILHFVVWVLILGALVLAALGLPRNRDRGDSRSESRESPLDILKRRYAKGEITKEEFDAMKRDLAA
jgi:putative membrane protein